MLALRLLLGSLLITSKPSEPSVREAAKMESRLFGLEAWTTLSPRRANMERSRIA